MSDKPYATGYGKPPKHTQFKKGCPSRNPRGRPRKEFNFADLIRKELDRRVKVRVNGIVITMTIREVWMRRVVNQSTQGKRRAQRTFVKVARPAEAWLGTDHRHIFYLIDSVDKDKNKDKPKS